MNSWRISERGWTHRFESTWKREMAGLQAFRPSGNPLSCTFSRFLFYVQDRGHRRGQSGIISESYVLHRAPGREPGWFTLLSSHLCSCGCQRSYIHFGVRRCHFPPKQTFECWLLKAGSPKLGVRNGQTVYIELCLLTSETKYNQTMWCLHGSVVKLLT